jgi:ABC-type uncharacterized transport system involved in gliding motility auxiliary subunit
MDQARLANERQAQFDEETDRMGPVPVASVFTRSLAAAPPPDSAGDGDPADAEGTREARLVVFGDSDLSANANVGSSGNGNLLLNTLSWLAEEEDLVAIRPKEGKNEPVMLSAEQGRLLFMLPVIGIPLATLVIGTAVVARRRWRR